MEGFGAILILLTQTGRVFYQAIHTGTQGHPQVRPDPHGIGAARSEKSSRLSKKGGQSITFGRLFYRNDVIVNRLAAVDEVDLQVG